MDDETFRRFDDYDKDGWGPHLSGMAYTCGWCGLGVSSQVGLGRTLLWMPGGQAVDVRICPECWGATTFFKHADRPLSDEPEQIPAPLKGENLGTSGKPENVKPIVALYDEARKALSQGAGSCAVLMFRKMLMHIAVEQGAPPGKKFAEYVEYLRKEGVVGKPQHRLVERIREAGNQENHEIVRATMEQAHDLLNVVTLLMRSVYFSD